ncbi:hypothetical protein OROMI_026563 [Orobanche minor]
MSRSSHLKLRHIESEDLGLLGSDSLPSEPPDIRQWFPNVYESPDLPELDAFQDSDGIGKTRVEEEKTSKSGNNQPIGNYGDDDCTGQVKMSDRIEPNGCGYSEGWKSVAKVSGSSESLLFSEVPSEPPDIRNWFPNYVYESPLLDTNDFVSSVREEMEDGKLDVGKSAGKNVKDKLLSIGVDKTESCALNDTSYAVGKGLNIEYQSVCKDDDDDDVTLQPLPSIPSLSCSDKATKPMLSQQKAGYGNYKSLEKIGRANKHVNENASPRTNDRIEPKGDCRGSQADRRSVKTENEETTLQEDGFISIRKRSRQENAENVARPRIEVKPLINLDNDVNIVRKVLSEISNFCSENIVGRTEKWACPQKNKPNLGPPLKQLRLDQWVRRV